jgi:hypothetical protein
VKKNSTKAAKPEKTFLDEIKRFSIHEHEYNQLPEKFKAKLSEYEDLDYFAGKMPKNRVPLFKKHLKTYADLVKKNKKVTNEECITLDIIFYLLDRMFADDIRKLKLERLLK